MGKIIVMLIWIHNVHGGGPATVQGFQDMDECRHAQTSMEMAAKEVYGSVGSARVTTKCVELN